jgi:hypothetical protein
MGSFTEVVLSFNFAKDTPAPVLAAFAALEGPRSEEAPPLPAPVEEGWDPWEPDWRLAGYPEGQGDPFEDEPWKHDWAAWTSTAMGVQTTPHGRLTWSALGLWNLDCRFSWKTDVDTASGALAWLAPHVDRTYSNRKILVGYAHDEYQPRPQLFWVDGGRWDVEDLNIDLSPIVPAPSSASTVGSVSSDEDRVKLEAEYHEVRRLMGTKMAEYYPERGRRRRPITDEEANAEIQQYAARAYYLEIVLWGPRRKPHD